MSESAEAGPEAVERGQLWKQLGAPQEQVGSVNDPREHEEQGHRWNEKWIYLDDSGQPERVVLWNRRDFLGLFRVTADGSYESEVLPGS